MSIELRNEVARLGRALSASQESYVALTERVDKLEALLSAQTGAIQQRADNRALTSEPRTDQGRGRAARG